MNRKKFVPTLFVGGIIAFVVIDFLLGFAIQIGEKSSMRVAKANQSVSLLAIQEYNAYNAFIEAILQNYNQHLKNFPQIAAGDTVFFPMITKPEIESQQFVRDDFTLRMPREQLQAHASEAIITYVRGEVLYQTQGDTIFHFAAENAILHGGDKIQTGANGTAELVLDHKSVLRIGPHSLLTIDSLSRGVQEAIKANFKFDLGNIWILINKTLSGDSFFNVQLPTTIAGVQGTEYRAEVASDSVTTIHVYDGRVQVQRAVVQRRQVGPPRQVPGPRQISVGDWMRLVRAQQQLRIKPDQAPGEPEAIPESDAQNDWVMWNRERDQLFVAE